MKTRLLCIVFALEATSCDKAIPADPPPAPYRMAIEAESDPGKPLPGVELRSANRVLGTTSESGRAVLSLKGAEGDSVSVTIVCPTQYQPPSHPLVLTLRRFVDRAIVPTYSVSCTPAARVVVVAIRADKGPNLPVIHLGREVARTDAAGIAHVLLEAKAGESEEFTLVTSDPRAALLRPANPSLAFVAKARDDYVLLEQKFVEERPRVRIAAPHTARPAPL